MTTASRSALSALPPRVITAALVAALLTTGFGPPAAADDDTSILSLQDVDTVEDDEPIAAPEPEESTDPTETAELTEPLEVTVPGEPAGSSGPTGSAGASPDAGGSAGEASPSSAPGSVDDNALSTLRTAVAPKPRFALPLPSGRYRMTSPQGPRCAPAINASLMHMGQDMAAPYGTPIYAIAAGTVRWARAEPSAGQWIVIEHVIDGRIVTSAYSHSRSATEFVRAGDRVAAGQRIASVASTGVSTGNHLHLEIWEGRYGTSGGGTVVNPDSWLAARGVSLRAGATSVYLPPPPTSCTYWSVGTTRLYSSPSSSASIVATVLGGSVLRTPGHGTKLNSFIRVTTSVGVVGWAPASQVSPNRIEATTPLGGVLNHDYNGDGFADIVAINAAGRFTIRMGNGADGWIRTRLGGTAWSDSRLLAANDADRDGRADLYRIDATGRLWFYAGRGDGTFRARVKVGSGFSSMTHVLAPGDFDGDGKVDLLAVDRTGLLWLYRGNGKGGLVSARVKVASGFGAYAQVIAGGDVNGDGRPDILTVDKSGRMVAHLGNRSGRITGTRVLGAGWASLQVQPIGRFDADRLDDYLAITRNGEVLLYRGSATSSSGMRARLPIGTGWTGYRLG